MMTEMGGLAKGRGVEPRIVFGPVWSQRLGTSLGVDNLRGTRCSYACRYCAVGDRVVPQRSRQRFFEPPTIVAAVRAAMAELPERVDHVTIVPTGEPTLDARLGETVVGLRGLGVPVAVFTNGSLLSRDDVRRELGLADVVSVKVDAADAATWRALDGPHEGLDFERVAQGMRVFAASFRGRLFTETTLMSGVNTSRTQLEAIADLVSVLKPERAYLSFLGDAERTGSAESAESAERAERAERAEALFAERLPEVVRIEPGSDRPVGRRLHLRRRLAAGSDGLAILRRSV